MTKKELFEKYSINESHMAWDNRIDSWYSVEIYRAMHDGKLPQEGDASVKWVLDFLDKCNAEPAWMMSLENWGSFFLTAKRMVYRFADQLSGVPCKCKCKFEFCTMMCEHMLRKGR